MFKLWTTPQNIEQVELFNALDNVSTIIIGSNKFGLRQQTNFDLKQISEIKQIIDKKLYIAINKIMHNQDLIELELYLEELNKIKIDGVIVGDLGVMQIIKEKKYQFDVIYNTETTITNQYFTEFAKNNGFKGVELAKEITLKEIIEIGEQKQCDITVLIQGHIYMYHSIRPLLSNYATLQNISLENEKYLLFDEERQVNYPIIENEQGTHVLSSQDVCMIDKMDRLSQKIGYLRIDGFLYSEKQYTKIVEMYNNSIDMLVAKTYENEKENLLEELKSICNDKNFSTGFYFKKTMY